MQMKNSPQMLPSAMMAVWLDELLQFAMASELPEIDVSRENPSVLLGYTPFPKS
jgi:hypothetical protein